MLEYIPEGQDDSASITLEPEVDISVWKERYPTSTEKNFILQWKYNIVRDVNDLFKNVLNGPFKAITLKSCSLLCVNKFDDLFKLNLVSGNNGIKIRFNGYFCNHHKVNNIYGYEAKQLIGLPDNVKLYARDKNDCLIIHSLMYNKKEVCKDDLIKHFLNEHNSNLVDCNKWNALHYACRTNNLGIVQSTIKYGGPIEQTESNPDTNYGDYGPSDPKDDDGEYPSDLTTNKEIKQYLKQLKNKNYVPNKYPTIKYRILN